MLVRGIARSVVTPRNSRSDPAPWAVPAEREPDRYRQKNSCRGASCKHQPLSTLSRSCSVSGVIAWPVRSNSLETSTSCVYGNRRRPNCS